jgi:hypothetical protein
MFQAIRRKNATVLSKALLSVSLLAGASVSPATAKDNVKVPIYPNPYPKPSWPVKVTYSYDLKVKLHPPKFDNSIIPSPDFNVKQDGSLVTASGNNYISHSISVGSLEEIHESTGQARVRIEPTAPDVNSVLANWLLLTAKADVQPKCAKEKDSCKDISASANVKIGTFEANDTFPRISGTLPVGSVTTSSVNDPKTVDFQYSIMPGDDLINEFSPFTIGFYMPGPTSLKANLIFKASDLYTTEFKIFGGTPNENTCYLTSATSQCDPTFVDSYESELLSQWHYEPALLSYILDSPLLFPEIGYKFIGSTPPAYTTTSTELFGDPASADEVVPGPLPILGVGMGFGFSRKLRKRIKLASSKG